MNKIFKIVKLKNELQSVYFFIHVFMKKKVWILTASALLVAVSVANVWAFDSIKDYANKHDYSKTKVIHYGYEWSEEMRELLEEKRELMKEFYEQMKDKTLSEEDRELIKKEFEEKKISLMKEISEKQKEMMNKRVDYVQEKKEFDNDKKKDYNTDQAEKYEMVYWDILEFKISIKQWMYDTEEKILEKKEIMKKYIDWTIEDERYQEKLHVLLERVVKWELNNLKREYDYDTKDDYDMKEKREMYEEKKEQYKKEYKKEMLEKKEMYKEKKEDMYKEKKKEIKEDFKEKRDEMREKYKKAFKDRLEDRLSKIETKKLERIEEKIEEKIEKIEESNMNEERKEKYVSQFLALLDLVQEEIENREWDINIDIDEILE